MGLDMYLSRKTYLPSFGEPLANEQLPELPFGINRMEVQEITERIGYWRKANAIHGWFVRHVQDGEDDCNEYPVSLANLELLQKDVEEVLAARGTEQEAEVAQRVLPPESGFFFGSTDIDQWYWQDLEDTREILKRAIDVAREDEKRDVVWSSIEYRSSW